MNCRLVLLLLLLVWSQQGSTITMEYIDKIIAMGPYAANWDSIVGRYKTPDWFMDAKFGFYTHWLISSVPAYSSEWYPREMYDQTTDEYQHQIKTYGPLSPTNGYKEFIPSFTGTNFDPDAWMKIFANTGAKYAGPVGEHHDGFPMYNCSLTPYTSVNMGPKRDVGAELLAASKRLPNKMYFIMSSHRAWHSAFYDKGRQDPTSDVYQCQCPSWQDNVDPSSDFADRKSISADPDYCQLYCPANPNETTPTDAFMVDWLLRTCEMADLYTPDVLYFDWWIGVSPNWKPYLQKLTAFYYNRLLMDGGRVGVITTKGTTMPIGADVLDFERGQACSTQKNYWQTDTSISVKSWGYIDNDVYKTAPDMLHSLIDIVSKNGGMLLNVGPPPNGTIPLAAQQSFAVIGQWLAGFGEAIYSTRPFHLFGEGPTQVPCGSFSDQAKNFTLQDFRFTINPSSNILYVICLGANPGDSVIVKSLGAGIVASGSISSVKALGTSSPVTWSVGSDGLHATIPASTRVPVGLPTVLAVSGLSDLLWDGNVRQGQDKSINLLSTLIQNFTGGVTLSVMGPYVIATKWGSASGSVSWSVNVRLSGNYKVSVLSASPIVPLSGVLMVQNQKVQLVLPETNGSTDYEWSTPYPVTLTQANEVTVEFQLVNPPSLNGYNLAMIQIVPA